MRRLTPDLADSSSEIQSRRVAVVVAIGPFIHQSADLFGFNVLYTHTGLGEGKNGNLMVLLTELNEQITLTVHSQYKTLSFAHQTVHATNDVRRTGMVCIVCFVVVYSHR